MTPWILLLVSAAAHAQSPGFPHADVSGQFRLLHQEALGSTAAVPEGALYSETLERITAHQFVHLPIGLFDLHYPSASLATEAGMRQWQTICEATASLQDRWLHLVLGTEPRRGRSSCEEIDCVARWIGSWKTRTLQRNLAARSEELAGGTTPLDFAVLTDADETVLSALSAWRTRALSGQDLGITFENRTPLQQVFAPTRSEFVGIACCFGEDLAAAKTMLWVESIHQWTEFTWKDLQVLALEYADPARTPEEYAQGLAMDYREPTGMEQHVVHNLALRLLHWAYEQTLDPALETGLATNLTVEILGEDNARVGGSGASGSTDARMKFVAGGRPQGGKFPRLNADSSWRADKGKDWFERALRAGQKRGAKTAPEGRGNREKEAWFALASAVDSKESLPVRAPFLGDAPGTPDIPAEFADDSQEFFRAYAASFVHWLRDQEAGSDKSGTVTFARLLRGAAASGENDFASLVSKIYGEPLTSADRDPSSLEWRFLRDLARR